jgi:cation transport ATPase
MSWDSESELGKMKRNLGRGAGDNTIAVLTAVGALLMSASTLVVTLNAQLLRRFDKTLTAT